MFTLVNVVCVAITYCFQLTGQKKYSSFLKNLPLYTNEFRLLADFPIKTLPIVACFTEIALFLCINHELTQQFLATVTKKTLKTGVIPLDFLSTFRNYSDSLITLQSKYACSCSVSCILHNINYLERGHCILTQMTSLNLLIFTFPS